MAGIVGLIAKTQNPDKWNALLSAFLKMFNVLGSDQDQRYSQTYEGGIFFGNRVPFAQKPNDHFQHDTQKEVYCIVEGILFCREGIREQLSKEYFLDSNLTDHQLLPYLYRSFGNQMVHHVTGWYNVFVWDKSHSSCLLFNDRLGYMPLYTFESAEVFMFSSKIESLIASGLMGAINYDVITMAEHLVFNYPVSDHTFIQGINTMPDGTLMQFQNFKPKQEKYWDIAELFGLEALSKKHSIDAIDNGLKTSVQNFLRRNEDMVNFSLTGGWDSRLVLSYLLPQYTSRIQCYSFGAPHSADILIPRIIAREENLSYVPFLLNDEYLADHFLPNALQTITWSNGTRPYKRAHYLYAVQQMGRNSPWLISGIFGDEVLKVGKPKGGVVISDAMIDFIDSGFNVDRLMQGIERSGVLNLLARNKDLLLSELADRIAQFVQRVGCFENRSESYFAFRFAINLRKYFGNEVNSYNDFVWCYSPFIDYTFLQALARSCYMGTRFDFVKPGVRWQAQSSRLYYELTKRNASQLANYNSSRGFSMKDVNTLPGLIRIIHNKILNRKKSQHLDAFNTDATESVFRTQLSNITPNDLGPIRLPLNDSFASSELQSLYWWTTYIRQKYSG